MRYRTLTVENWVVFEGEQVFEFSTDQDAPISVVFATNGAGKTSVLNALVWGLYGEFAGGFEHGERLLNKSVFDKLEEGDTAHVGVVIEFEHQESVYTVTRRAGVVRRGPKQDLLAPELTLRIKSADTGTTKTSTNPQDEINQVLGAELKDFFFFTPERMEELTGRANRKQVRDAITALLDIELLTRAHRHTSTARTRLAKELPQSPLGDQRIAEVEGEIADAEQLVAESIQSIEGLERQLVAADTEVADRKNALLRLQEVADFQKERETNKGRIKAIDTERQDLIERLRKRLADDAFVPFIHGAFAVFDERYEEALASGEFPPPVDLSLVERLLELELCLCEEPLIEGEPRRTRIEELRGMVASAEPTKSLLKDTRRAIDSIRTPQEVSERLRDVADRRAELGGERNLLDARNSELRALIGDFGGDALEAERNLETAEALQTGLSGRLAGANRDLGAREQTVKGLEDSLEKAKKDRQFASVGERRVDLAREVERFFEKARNIRQRTMRDKLVEKVNQLYKRVIIKPYRVTINDDFDLDVEDESLYSTGVSAAERSILTMSFVGALSSVSTAAGSFMGGPSGSEGYSLVLDAPFSNIDAIYDEPLGEALTSLPGQVIVFVSPRWASIIEFISDDVGTAYCLHMTGSDLQLPEGMESPTFLWRGQPVTYITVDEGEPMVSVEAVALGGGAS